MYVIDIVKRGPTPKLMQRELNTINRETVRMMGQFWHQKYFAKHFTHAGATEYGYTPRNKFYELKKLKVHGHTYPLKYSGRGQQDASHPRIVATATRHEAKVHVIMHAPVFNFRNPHSRINMRVELTTVSLAEIQAIANEASFFQHYLFCKLGRTPTRSRAA
jgi:hypothetical protein